MDIANCRSCGRKIIWTTSPAGALLPLDARAVTVYRIVDGTEPPDAVKIRTTLRTGDGYGDQQDINAYISHFLTCPTVGEHTK